MLWQALLTQASAVQTLPSSHWLAELQQLAIFVLVQLPWVASQTSVVHGSLSSQSAAALQQPGICACWQTLLTQLSVVQLLLSAH